MASLVKIILSLTRPEKPVSPNKRHLPFKTSIYVNLMKMLASYYGKYSSEDVIFIGKAMVMKHSFRDPEFEKELKRINVSLKPHMSSGRISKGKPTGKTTGSSSKPFYSFFNFYDRTIVTGFGKEITIDRTSDVDVYGTFDAKVRNSAESDPISVTAVDITLPKVKKAAAPSAEPIQPKTDTGLKKDTVPNTSLKKETAPGKEEKPETGQKKEVAPKKEEKPEAAVKPDKGAKTRTKKDKTSGRMFAKETIPKPAPKPEPKPAPEPEPETKQEAEPRRKHEPKPEKPEVPENKIEPIEEKPTTTIVRGIEIDDDF